MLKKLTYSPFYIKLTHWEYWPFHVVYFPVYFYWFWLSVKARSFFFFSTANPSIENSGFLMEKKKDIYDLMPKAFYPKTILIQSDTNATTLLNLFVTNKYTYPVITKPNIGERGVGVAKLENEQELIQYLQQSKVDFLLQQWIGYSQEAGIFYYRYPNQQTGIVSGIVGKEFLQVVGNGVSTTEQLLRLNTRFVLQLAKLTTKYGKALQNVLPLNEVLILVPYGNHSRGSKFVDASSVITPQLQIAIDSICKQISGFYFGRLDIKFNTWDDVANQKNFSIIELNGAGSEPTHIYDPKHSIWFAWKEIIKHLNILYTISKQNKVTNNLQYMTIAQGLKMFRDQKEYYKML